MLKAIREADSDVIKIEDVLYKGVVIEDGDVKCKVCKDTSGGRRLVCSIYGSTISRTYACNCGNLIGFAMPNLLN